jgi:glutathione S-transferase
MKSCLTSALLLFTSLVASFKISNLPTLSPPRMKKTSLSLGLKLYGHQGTRSPLINWACYELGVDFEMGDLDQCPHPFSQVPCLTKEEDDIVLFESGAILQYLNINYAKDLTKAQMAAVMSWIAWANASLDPICFKETPDGKVFDTGLKQPNRRIAQLDEMLSKNLFLLDKTFTLADVAVSSYLLYVIQFFPDVDLSRWPSIVRYMKSCASRPAYGRAFGEDLQSRLVGKLAATGSPKKKFGAF